MTFDDWIEKYVIPFVFVIFCVFIMVAIGFCVWEAAMRTATEHNRIYTMVVDVYYTDTPERHTYVSDGHEIMYHSNRGTNFVQGEKLYLSTTAPVKVVSNTYKEKKCVMYQ